MPTSPTTFWFCRQLAPLAGPLAGRVTLCRTVVFAIHVIFTAYGFWLPNDPRGSWSDFVACWKLFWFGGPATKTTERRSLARRRHNRALRMIAKRHLKFPPVQFIGRQARCIAEAIGRAADEAGYVIYACAIMPDHVHLVTARHPRPIKQIVGHLNARATMLLNQLDLHPLGEFRNANGSVPTPWVVGCWKVFLDSHADVVRAIDYVEGNPTREGFKPQKWKLVTRYRR